MALGAVAGVDIAAEDIPGEVHDRLRTVGKDDLALRALFLYEVLVILNVVHAGEGVAHIAEVAAVLGQAEHVAVGVHTALVQRVEVKEVVANLVAGIAEHEHHFPAAAGDAAQADGEAVAGEDGEHHAHGLPA